VNKLKKFFKRYEFRRKAVHIISGILVLLFINWDNDFVQENLVYIFLAGLIITILFSIYTKYKHPYFILNILKLFEKPKDIRKYPCKGAVYYFTGVLITILLFPRDIASASIAILTIGDPMAHFFGSYYGKKKLIINRKKLLEGTLAGTLFGTLAASIFVPWPLAFFGAAFGMMAEAVELEFFRLDDNFFIPFISGIVMVLIKSVL
jgi:dolichol kinase